MTVFQKDALVCLALLVSSAEAANLSDPVICYVLDAVLLFYCIIFTALYFKLKFQKAKTFVKAPDKSPSGDQEEEAQYQTLVGPSSDDYQEIQRRDKPRKKKSKSKEPKSKSNAAEGIEMKSVPPLPTRD